MPNERRLAAQSPGRSHCAIMRAADGVHEMRDHRRGRAAELAGKSEAMKRPSVPVTVIGHAVGEHSGDMRVSFRQRQAGLERMRQQCMRERAELGTADALCGSCKAKFSSFGDVATLMASRLGQKLHGSFRK
jgi:hypothetical protein